ncbi:MAG: hypothetical protein JRJ03_15365 [Deltaproteobacteria bacterium]|nr:hypothetical protein [Deltaproteobacteria bacterium]
MSESRSIFSPIRVGPHELRNRLVALPVYTGYAHPGGRVSALLIEHYTRLADSGAGMVVVANAAVSPDGIGSTYNLRIDRDEFLPGLTRLARAIKGRGAFACLQLNHAGRFAKTEQPLLPAPADSQNLAFNIASLKDFMNFFPLEKRFSLTRYFLKLFSTWRRAMTAEDHERIMIHFADGAARACEAGFDMIELHGANGYLICQFLSTFTNREQSDVGGDFHGRISFPLAIIKKIRERVPKGFPMGFRLLLEEWVPGGINLEEALAWARTLEKEGIAYLSATAGTYSSIFCALKQKEMSRPAFLRKNVAKLTHEVNVPTIIAGRIITPSLANKLISEGAADLIGLGRPLRADFDWIRKASDNQVKDINYCINCNWCLKRVILDQGFNCKRWPRSVQERIDLDHKLLTRMYKGLWIAADKNDLALFRGSLPLFLPERQRSNITISPTILFLQKDREDLFTNGVKEDFLHWGRKMLLRHGHTDGYLTPITRTVKETYEKEVHEEIERGQHGVIVLGRNLDQTWRQRLLYKERGKVIILLGSSERQSDILVPVDFSASTLLVLMFVCHSYIGKPGFNLQFVHVLTGPARPAQQRWKELREIVGWDEDFQLQCIPPKGSVAASLLEKLDTGNFGTVIMGKRGLSGIKRRLLGSVSAKVLRGLKDQTLFLID